MKMIPLGGAGRSWAGHGWVGVGQGLVSSSAGRCQRTLLGMEVVLVEVGGELCDCPLPYLGSLRQQNGD